MLDLSPPAWLGTTIKWWLTITTMSLVAAAQTVSGVPQRRQPIAKPVSPQASDPLPQPLPRPEESRARTPEDLPPSAPQVSWDGKQLTIRCENSTLGAILAAVRGRIHASIDIPPGAAAERVAAQLGPGQAREVLTSLLSGSNFNYIIRASETDEDAIRSVVLTPRGRSDDSITASGAPASQGVRLMPGYSNSSRGVVPDSQRNPVPEIPSTDPSAAVEISTPSQNPSSSDAEPVSETAQSPSEAIPQPGSPDSLPADRASGTGPDRPAQLPPSTSPGSAADAGQPASSTSQMVQDL